MEKKGLGSIWSSVKNLILKHLVLLGRSDSPNRWSSSFEDNAQDKWKSYTVKSILKAQTQGIVG